MKNIFKQVLFVALTTLSYESLAQVNGDSVLANERSIDRPITLHAKQLRIKGGYDLSIFSKRYGMDGKAIKLRDEGLSSVSHNFNVEVMYGLLEYLQVTMATGHGSRAVREQNVGIFGTPDPSIDFNKVTDYKGMRDLYVGLDGRMPWKTKKIDIGLSFGASLPTANNEPDVPEHKYIINGSMINVEYRHHEKLGSGVTIAHMGGMVKYRTPSMAYSLKMNYQHGLKTGNSGRWLHQLNSDMSFSYLMEKYEYQLADRLSYYGEIEYQRLPWFDIVVGLGGYSCKNGWQTSPMGKIGMPDQSLFFISPGYELLVTSKLWIRQFLTFPVSGKSVDAPFTINTTLLYNFFPFK